ncbi:MAG TPA: ATP synthase F1 subunit delta [Polyangiaceae bacterium]|nr:ATP synthase F1 subunit delta [Polyangiaceae bacterium]
MSEGVVAQRYAQALFELGSESGQLAQLSEKISDFAVTFSQSKELRGVLENPLTSKEQREAVLRDVAQRLNVPETGVRGLLLLARRRRLSVLPALARRLRELSDEKDNIVRATVTTAQKMPESYYQALEKALGQATSRRVIVERAEDPELLGGAVTRLGDSVIDNSLQGRLHDAEQRLLHALSSLAAS